MACNVMASLGVDPHYSSSSPVGWSRRAVPGKRRVHYKRVSTVVEAGYPAGMATLLQLTAPSLLSGYVIKVAKCIYQCSVNGAFVITEEECSKVEGKQFGRSIRLSVVPSLRVGATPWYRPGPVKRAFVFCTTSLVWYTA